MCKHLNFITESKVARLTDDNGNVMDYMLEVTVTCSDCLMPFLFKGIKSGISFDEPRLNLTRTELRIPLEPVKV